MREAAATNLSNTPFPQLTAVLDDSEREMFEKYCDAQDKMGKIIRHDTFTYALKFGILLMIEVFMGKEEITGEDEFPA